MEHKKEKHDRDLQRIDIVIIIIIITLLYKYYITGITHNKQLNI